jgi:hypothetical protein
MPYTWSEAARFFPLHSATLGSSADRRLQRSHDIPELFKADGIYGRLNWYALVIYALAVGPRALSVGRVERLSGCCRLQYVACEACHRGYRTTLAIWELTGMLLDLSPGVWPCRSNSRLTPGRNSRQWVEPPKWNMPSWLPFFTRWPS